MRVFRSAALLVARLSLLAALLTSPSLVVSSAVAQSSGPPAESDSTPEPGQTASNPTGALIQILEDPAALKALIEHLRATAGVSGTLPPESTGSRPTADTAATQAAPPQPSFAREIAEYTQHVAEGVSGFARRLTSSISDITSVATGERRVNWDRVGNALVDMATVAAGTIAAFWVLKLLAARVFRAMALRAENASRPRRVLLLLGSTLVDAVSILLAWGGGYVLALSLGMDGRMSVQQSLFLNAFLIVEMAKVILRGVLAPGFEELRWLPMPDRVARHWYFWTSRIVDLLGYGLLLIVPLVNSNISFVVGRSLRLLIVVVAALIAVGVILRNRRPVRRALRERHEREPDELVGTILAYIGTVWHLAAGGYILALVAIWVSRPTGALTFMIGATIESALAIGLGVLAVALISKTIAGGVRLPASVSEQLPLLERRLNTFVPRVLRVVRLVVFVAVVVSIGQSWQILDFLGWLGSSTGLDISTRLSSAIAILLAATLIWLAVSSWIEFRLNPNTGRTATARERTLLSLFRNAFMIAVLIIAAMLTLSQLGVDIGPLLAGAGVLGLAIGFGAQKLVQDIITGAFIQIENAMNEGDVVTIAGVSGTVERLTIRSVGLRDLSGTYHLIPFSSVDQVSNFMRGFAYHVAEIGVAYRENISEVKALMQEAFERLKETQHGPNIIGELEMHGVTALGDSAVVVRARIKAVAGTQWGLGRAYTEIVKEVLDAHGVEIPFPHMTLYWGEDKQGNAPPMRLLNASAPPNASGASSMPAPSPGTGSAEPA